MKSPSHQRLSTIVQGAFTPRLAIRSLWRDKSINLLRLQPYLLIGVTLICFTSCATRPRTYQPPDAGKLKASTERVSKAVDSAHQNARKAQGKVTEAADLAKEVQKETIALKDVPVTLVAKVNELEVKLDEAKASQSLLEQDLVAADKAKADVERDKTEYFTAAQKLAQNATDERTARIKAEKEASSLKWHSWLYRILGTVGVLLMIGFVVLWFMGKIALKLSG